MNSRTWLIVPAVVGLVGVACQSALTQYSAQQPQVISPPASDPAKPAASPAVPETGYPASPMQAPVAEAQTGPVRMSYTACNVDGPFIALTFDDGPSEKLTPKLLDILKEKEVKATFFVLGQCVEANPDVLKRAADEGHEIGNHSWGHNSFQKIGAAGIASEVNRTNDAIMAATGKKPTTLRPPYGATNAGINKRLNEEFGLKVIMWDVDPLDWKNRNSDRVTSEIIKGTKAGSIVLAHDIHPTTIGAMAAAIDALKEKGFKFVTVSELIAMDRPQIAAKTDPKPRK